MIFIVFLFSSVIIENLKCEQRLISIYVSYFRCSSPEYMHEVYKSFGQDVSSMVSLDRSKPYECRTI